MPWRLALATSLGVVAVGCATAVGLGWGPATSGDAPSQSRPGAAGRPHDVPVVPAHRAGAVRPEVPLRSVLPGGRLVPVLPAGTADDGSLAVPTDIRVAGWWRGGARLGDPFGSTLLAAHVDSFTQGLGPYAALLSARAGQRIVLSSRHLTQTFSVVSLAVVPRGTLSEHGSIFSSRGRRRLVLVTCAGPYDAARGGYQNLAVVTALPVADASPRSGR